MFKLITVTLTGFFVTLLVFGDESRREEVSRAAPDDELGFSFASFVPQSDAIEAVALDPISEISEEEAIAIAVAEGQRLRSERDGASETRLLGAVPATSEQKVTLANVIEDTPNNDTWYVSGVNVNLRSGPGTGNAVVAQLGLGTKAEALSDTEAEWIEIRTADGTAGWIFGKFLSDSAPG